MKAVFVIISFTLLLLFLQTSAEESQDASLSREVRAADAGKKDAGATKGKKKCKGKKCQKMLRTKEKGTKKEKEKKKCKKGKNCKRRNKGKGRKAKGRKEKKEKRPRGRKGGKGKKGGKGSNGKGGKDTKRKGTKGKGRKGKGGNEKKGKGGKGRKGRNKKGGKGKGKKPRGMNIRFRNSGKQNGTVPAKCSANTCTPAENVDLFNAYKKNDNMLRQLQRLVRFYDLIGKKANSGLTTFDPAAKAISTATNNCTKCAEGNASAAIADCKILRSCSVTAPAICSVAGITYEKVKNDCPTGDTCPAGSNKTSQCGTACPSPSPTGPPDCSDVCKTSDGNAPVLTEADRNTAENDCIPVLKKWNKQYRDCNAGDTFGCQQSGCNDKKGECNLKNCKCETPDRTCDFEECVDAKNTDGDNYKDYVCNTCLKNLKANLAIPASCAKIAKYERAVFARKEECIRKDKTGSFGDCAKVQKAIIPMIIPCLGTDTTLIVTTPAPSGRRLSALKNQNMFQNKKQFW